MKKRKLICVFIFILVMTMVVLLIPGGEAHAAINPIVTVTKVGDQYRIYVGPDAIFMHLYFFFRYEVKFCDGSTEVRPQSWRLREAFFDKPIKSYRVVLYEEITMPYFMIDGETNFCDVPPGPAAPTKPKFKANCNKFTIDSPVKQGMWVEFTFKGSFHIDSAYIYFSKLNLTLYPSLASYDWATKTWTGYLNTGYLPTGKHHGRLFVSYEGAPGKSCSTGSFKVVE